MALPTGEPEQPAIGPTDGELWRRSAEGDATAFSVLYRRHFNVVLGFCLRRTADPALAEDLASTVFLEAWRCRNRLELSQDAARPLLLGIATNLLRHHWRARRRHAAALTRLRGTAAASSTFEDEDAAIARLDAKRALREAREILDRLPRRERDVLSLIAWGDLSYEEVAAALRIPIGTVRSRLARARRKLADSLAVNQPPTPLSAETTDTAVKGAGQ